MTTLRKIFVAVSVLPIPTVFVGCAALALLALPEHLLKGDLLIEPVLRPYYSVFTILLATIIGYVGLVRGFIGRKDVATALMLTVGMFTYWRFAPLHASLDPSTPQNLRTPLWEYVMGGYFLCAPFMASAYWVVVIAYSEFSKRFRPSRVS